MHFPYKFSKCVPFVGIAEAIVPGAGAFEIGAHCMLKNEINKVKGRAKLGVQVSKITVTI